ncbi:YsnF/AvaK domain-containing protein [Arthrobacter sp. H41]|uniref:YsnF/AvaK domain-containing protein n=1 Tax=Arthrobacter sp. H41 TaxID=1312978 RepID=UPI0004B343CE|nr:YsnF/AvaK domain-containing protein [Arthrobacter sp. H41]
MVMRKQAGPPGENGPAGEWTADGPAQASGISGHVNKKAGKGTARATDPIGDTASPGDARSSAMTGPSGRKGRKGKKIAGRRTAAGDSAGNGGTGTGRSAEAGPSAGQVIVLSEEQVRVIPQTKQLRRVRLHKTVVTENVTRTITVRREEIRIDRGPGTDAAAAVEHGMATGSGTGSGTAPGVEIGSSELEGGGYSIVLSEERPVIRMESVAVKRIRLTKERILTEESLSTEVRKEVLEPGVDDATHQEAPVQRSTDDYAG